MIPHPPFPNHLGMGLPPLTPMARFPLPLGSSVACPGYPKDFRGADTTLGKVARDARMPGDGVGEVGDEVEAAGGV